jgi:hypothetical protein
MRGRIHLRGEPCGIQVGMRDPGRRYGRRLAHFAAQLAAARLLVALLSRSPNNGSDLLPPCQDIPRRPARALLHPTGISQQPTRTRCAGDQYASGSHEPRHATGGDAGRGRLRPPRRGWGRAVKMPSLAPHDIHQLPQDSGPDLEPLPRRPLVGIKDRRRSSIMISAIVFFPCNLAIGFAGVSLLPFQRIASAR